MTGVADYDTHLMTLVQRDDAESFGALLDRNRCLVVNYLARMVTNRAIAEELAQDVFIRVYRSRRTYEPSARFSTWLYRIATNVALNHFRDEKRAQHNISLDMQDAAFLRRATADQTPLVEHQLVQAVMVQQIRRAIRALPPKQRAAVIMHKYEGMDYAQISRVLGCSPSAVKALMFRAYETLRLRLRFLQTA
jgi:RNA polymerase sigma-70 factor, ECF subfamily